MKRFVEFVLLGLLIAMSASATVPGNHPLNQDTISVSAEPAPLPLTQSRGQTPLPIQSRWGTPASAVELTTDRNFVYMNDVATPDQWDVITPLPDTNFFAGDFCGGDFSKVYVLDYFEMTLSTIDVATGAITLIGSSLVSGTDHHWSGLTGASDGTLYASSTNVSNSKLYTINPLTGEATVIGTITDWPAIIDIAISPAGVLYAVDIANDVLIRIDTTTAVSTYVGTLGFDANNAQDMEFDDSTGILYLAAYNRTTARGELRICNTATGSSTIAGTFPNVSRVDCFSIAASAEPPSAGTISFEYRYYNCESSVEVRVRDSDMQGSGPLSVSLTSTASPSGINVPLTEGDPGVFTGSVDISASGGAGNLLVNTYDTITALYHDANYGGAGAQDVTSTTLADCVLPIISNVAVEMLTATSATITWTTDEPANSTVHYGPSAPPTEEMTDPYFTTTHSVTITDLESCTDYIFSVQSMDRSSNTATDNNGGQYYTFKTLYRMVFLEADMDTDPGWAISGGQWAWGQPAGNGGDPNSGLTGQNVYGYNLNGKYANNIPEYTLTTPIFDCSEATTVTGVFYHWLGVEATSFDKAKVQVSTNSGTNWITLWTNPDALVQETQWTISVADLTSVAAGKSTVQLRWTMGPTDSTGNYAGWNLDDIIVYSDIDCAAGTPTPDATETPVPEPTQTPTPPIELGVRLDLPVMIHPGESFHVTGYLDNPGAPLTNQPVFFILGVYSDFFFWPTWTHYAPPAFTEIDWDMLNVPTGSTEITVLPGFDWPDTGNDNVTGLYFYGAMLNADMSEISGAMAAVEWGYGPQ